MNIDDLFDGKRTTYSIADESGEKSSLTIDKWAADLLQDMKPNVHVWLQEKYNVVAEKRALLTRRQKGNVVRELARREAEKSDNYISLIDFL
jgi:hypothetical protein